MLKIICKHRPLMNCAGRDEGNTALMYACLTPNGDPELVPRTVEHYYLFILILLKEGADPNILNRAGRLPLHNFLCAHKIMTGIHPDLFHKTLYQMVDLTRVINTRGLHGDTPLHDAVKFCELAVEYLLQKGADPSIKNSQSQIPLHFVRSVEVFRLLVDKCPETSAMCCLEGMSPLHYALKEDRFEIAKEIIQRKNCLLFALNKNRESCLHFASRITESETQLAVIESLLQSGVLPHMRTSNGDNCFHKLVRSYAESINDVGDVSDAAMSNFESIVDAFVKRNGRIDETSSQGETPVGILGKESKMAYEKLKKKTEPLQISQSEQKSAKVGSKRRVCMKVRQCSNMCFTFAELTGIIRGAGGIGTEKETLEMWECCKNSGMGDIAGALLLSAFL